MPEVFVAVMGIEKVIPKLEDLSLSSKFWRAQPPARSLPAIPISSAPRATTATSTVRARCTW
jgi:L-lactate utilization protein LutB